MRKIQIVNNDRSLSSPIHAIYCDSFLCRLRGLMFRSNLAQGEGLLLVEGHDSRLDTSIHMFFVFMDLAVVWINSSYTVADTVLARAWHPAYAPHQPARYILEIHPSRLGEFIIGDQVKFTDV